MVWVRLQQCTSITGGVAFTGPAEAKRVLIPYKGLVEGTVLDILGGIAFNVLMWVYEIKTSI